MQVQSTRLPVEPAFIPVKLEILIETQDEYTAISRLTARDITVPAFVVQGEATFYPTVETETDPAFGHMKAFLQKIGEAL